MNYELLKLPKVNFEDFITHTRMRKKMILHDRSGNNKYVKINKPKAAFEYDVKSRLTSNNPSVGSNGDNKDQTEKTMRQQLIERLQDPNQKMH